jgi:transposase
MDGMTIAIDLAKDVFEVAIAPSRGRQLEHRRLSRRQFSTFVDAIAAGTTVLMEACGTAHYWGRRCQARGARVRLLPAQYVRPYVRRNKTDRADAAALLEAHRAADIHPVPIKTIEQQAMQSLHRVRAQWQATRIARINIIRAILRENGAPLARGAVAFRRRATLLLDDPTLVLPAFLRTELGTLLEEVQQLESRISASDRQLTRIARQHPIATRLQQIPGIGVLTATALVGSVPHIHGFRRGRQFASWLGLTPRESSSGTRYTRGGISKRGDVYLRCLLAHGSRAVLRAALHRPATRPLTRFEHWALAIADRRGRNRATMAIANKLARFVWAVWTRDQDFEAHRRVA